MFPNPSSGVATIQFPLSGDYALEVSDVTGRVVLKDRFFGSKYVLLTDEFSEGLYAVTIRAANRSPYVKLLVVARDE
jgi:hypothetical protein